jgi:hypothetical protein
MVPMPFWKSVVRFNVCIAEYPMFRCACVHGVSASDIVLRRVKKPVGKKFIRRNADASTNVEKMHVVSLGYQLESFLFYKRERERERQLKVVLSTVSQLSFAHERNSSVSFALFQPLYDFRHIHYNHMWNIHLPSTYKTLVTFGICCAVRYKPR